MKVAYVLMVLSIAIGCAPVPVPEGQPASNTQSVIVEDFVTLEKGVESEYKSYALLAFKDRSSWEAHYALTRGGDFDRLNTPFIDFLRENVVAVHLGSSTRGSSVEITSVKYDSSDATMQVRYKEVTTTSQVTQRVFVAPYHIVRVPRTSLSYMFLLTEREVR